jgi:hypothetical protein
VRVELNASHVVWMQITDLGREAIARWAAPVADPKELGAAI